MEEVLCWFYKIILKNTRKSEMSQLWEQLQNTPVKSRWGGGRASRLRIKPLVEPG